MFDDQLLQAFISGFYGYGNYDGKYWFVGIEEHGGELQKDIAQRLNAWDRRGRSELEDVVDYHREIGITHHFDERAVLQPTWNKIIRVLLGIEGRKPTTAEVKEYQKNQLARTNGKSCLIELLPLPSPKTNVWLYYPKYSKLPFLKRRGDYIEHVKPQRIAHLKRRIEEHKPEVVVFYSMGYQEDWHEIAGVEFQSTESDGVKVGKSKETLFVITKHPATTGVTNAYFHEIGQMIASSRV